MPDAIKCEDTLGEDGHVATEAGIGAVPPYNQGMPKAVRGWESQERIFLHIFLREDSYDHVHHNSGF